MPRRQLTDRFCDHAKTDGQQIDYFDEAVSGLARILVRLGAAAHVASKITEVAA